MKLLIINTGGTFNKRYDEIKGELFVPCDNKAVEAICEKFHGNIDLQITGALFKDSLEMDDADRQTICDLVSSSRHEKIVIVHGTDTMDLTAMHLDSRLDKSKTVVLAGAMMPFSIDPVEAACNLSMSIGFLSTCNSTGIFICMHGLVSPHTEIFKDKSAGIFRPNIKG